MNFLKKRNRAFTLWELTITMGLFLLVAGLAIAFISFMSNFTARNTVQNEWIKQITGIRSEIDYWFSVFDSDSYTIVIPDTVQSGDDSEGEITVAYARNTTTSEVYEMRLALLPVVGEKETFRHTLVCYYPISIYHGAEQTFTKDGKEFTQRVETVSCSHINAVRLYHYSDEWKYIEGESNSFRFLIDMHIQNTIISCVILYE